MKLAAAKEMKELDRRAIEDLGIPSIDLMERAARGVAEAALSLLPEGKGKYRAAVFCGSGNNGGDGIAAARMLFLKGLTVRIFLVGSYEKLTPDAMEETRCLSECGLVLEDFDPDDPGQVTYAKSCHVLIDAIFGVGLSREIHPDTRFAAAIRLMNDCPGKVVAADISSGVDADTGRILGCAAKCDKTVTFTIKKLGQVVGVGAEYSGEVICHDIGIPERLVAELGCPAQTVEEDFLREALPGRKADGHKGTFGKVLVVGGAVGYTGAPYLTAEAAVRSGCGLVFLGVPEKIWPVEAVKCTSAMPFPLADSDGKIAYDALKGIREKLAACDVLALGPGLGRSSELTKLVCTLMEETEKPVVLDADGINALEGHIDSLDSRRGRVTILTPHDGEFARIGGDLSSGDRLSAARDFAVEHGCILVLKGHRTLIAAPEGNVLVNTTGNSGLAKGGSGDVLTGIIVSLLAQGASPIRAAALGVWLHGRSGELTSRRLTPYAMTPEDVVASLPEAFFEIM
ncbi:MAG: NAD(P)H-hydrate dehydratase [Oscillibacter sp.]|nr:NAD(P)H-hydrate dehydratase [Oscillibacter sp.]